jgi:ribosomal protein L40E
MPCYRCGARQVDPVRGHSPWRRGVRGDQQVLVCPACQAANDWTADMDKCPQCVSAHLVRRLGEVECKDCGAVVPPAAESAEAGLGEPGAGVPGTPAAAGGRAPGLSEEVALALERVLGRSAARG